MTRKVVAAALGITLIVGSMVMVGSVAAQQAGEPTGTDTNPGSEATDTGPEASNESGTGFEERLDRYVVVQSYDYNSDAERWTITFDAQEPATVTLAESGQFEEGSARFSITQERVSRGRTTVTLDAPLRNGEAQVSLTTSRSIDNGHGVILSTGQNGDNPFSTTGTMGWFGGAAVVFCMGVWAFRHRLRGGSGGPEEAWG